MKPNRYPRHEKLKHRNTIALLLKKENGKLVVIFALLLIAQRIMLPIK
ncbi:hypothetical protein BPO_1054 [Bergeyella porcorum]|uniref:Uncharacterized protein n=1 Tax=Bergeyella porcorum TaxID=1735111 RepID=A0AAU0F6T9_9FLAO